MKSRKVLTTFIVLLALLSVAIVVSAEFGGEQKLQGEAPGFRFGTAIASAGKTAVIGAPGNEEVTVWHNSNGNWAQVATLTASAPGRVDRFGFSVDISEDEKTIVVGSHAINATWGKATIYVFERQGNNWASKTEDATLTVGNPPATNFGFSVAISADGSKILVGTRFDKNVSGNSTGAAYLFMRGGNSWTSKTTADKRLINPHAAKGDQFGFSVGIGWKVRGDVMVVGAPGDDRAAPNAGAVYLYWDWPDQYELQPTQELARQDPEPGDGFGFAVDGGPAGHFIVGAPGYPDRLRGSAYTFYYHEWAWGFYQDEKLMAPSGSNMDGFGFSVEMLKYSSESDYVAAVGAPGENGKRGAVYVFDGEGSGGFQIDFSLKQRLSASDGDANDRFGAAVSVSRLEYTGSLTELAVMAGAPGNGDNGTKSGAVYSYSDDDY